MSFVARDIVQPPIARRVHCDIVAIGLHYTKSTSDVVMVICNRNPLQLFIVELVSWNTTIIIVALQCQLRTITCNGCMPQTPFLCASLQPVFCQV